MLLARAGDLGPRYLKQELCDNLQDDQEQHLLKHLPGVEYCGCITLSTLLQSHHPRGLFLATPIQIISRDKVSEVLHLDLLLAACAKLFEGPPLFEEPPQ